MISMAAVTSGSLEADAGTARFPVTLEHEADRGSTMDDQSFRLFYERTARSLQAYLIAATGNPTAAEDLLQEAYFRLLRAGVEFNDETHRRNYLFRIATNLLRDRYRRQRPETDAPVEAADPADQGAEVRQRTDMSRILGELKPRERELLWLAYVEGMSHREIANALGLKAGSIRPLLFRARQRMAAVLHERGWTP
jgi:RNA polymerase sigma-70 factor (ECF subfamily)